jgi:aspartokinase-like uncharacterized kinase
VAITWAVKLGGSLARSARLPGLLQTLADARVVLVPGGGPFADQVRELQSHWGFDDRSAHLLALGAMAQYGRMLAALEPRLRITSDPAALAPLLAAGHAAVWLPDPSALAHHPGLPATWDLTSDSLAAWLAARIDARRLLLVKSAQPPAASLTCADLAADGLVDPCFPAFAAATGVEIWLAGPDEADRLAAGLTQPEGVLRQAQG